MQIEFVANAGFLMHAENYAVGVDVFSSDENGIYQDTSQEWKEKLWEMVACGKLRLLIVTHEHADHYCRRDVMEALDTAAAHHTALRVLTTQAVALDLLKAGADRERLLVVPSEPHPGEVPLCRELENVYCVGKEVCIRARNVPHEGEQYQGVWNIVLLIEAEGKKIVSVADACPEERLFLMIAEWSKQIDWLLVPFPYMGRNRVRKSMNRVLDIQKIAVFHFPEPDRDVKDWYRQTVKVCQRAEDSLPVPLFLRTSGMIFT